MIDTETTGLNPQKHILIQLAAAALDKDFDILETFCADVKGEKGFEYSDKAMEITGFTEERILNGENPEKVANDFLDFIKNNFGRTPILVGQFFPFDYAVLTRFFENVDKMPKWLDLTRNKILDTKSLAISANIYAEMQGEEIPFPVTSLSKEGGLKDKFGLGQYQAHDALGDVLATRDVLIKLLKRQTPCN